jgi:hypothetical protein
VDPEKADFAEVAKLVRSGLVKGVTLGDGKTKQASGMGPNGVRIKIQVGSLSPFFTRIQD